MTKDEALKLALDYLERHAIIDGIPARDAIREILAQPKHPDTFGVLFAVERSVESGNCPFEIEAAFEEYEEARKARSQS